MKKFLSSFVLVLVALVFAVNVALAYPYGTETKVDPFEGTFTGLVTGDRVSEAYSKAAFTFVLEQDGSLVSGEIALEDGLYVDGGLCWRGYLPAGVFSASGNTLSKDPQMLQGKYSYKINGITINGYIEAELSPDRENLDAEVKIDLPWFCGNDPVLHLNAERVTEG